MQIVRIMVMNQINSGAMMRKRMTCFSFLLLEPFPFSALFNPFQVNVLFLYSLKTRGFLMFSEGIEMEYCLEIG